MTLKTTLAKFNAKAFEGLQKDINSLGNQITSYQTQQRKIDRLAMLAFGTFAVLVVKLAWNKLSGTGFKTALFSSSSIILGLFDLAVGSGALWYWIDKNSKTKQIADEIARLAGLTRKNFYGETAERRQDQVTTPEVLDSMQENLKPLLEEAVPIERDYILIVTYEFSMDGDSAENFKISSNRILDNFKEIEATVAVWRSYYFELYQADPASRTSVIMQAIASQCIQELPSTKIDDGTSYYSCSSPAILNPKSGIIEHHYQAGPITKKKRHYNSPSEFRTHLAKKTQKLTRLRQEFDDLPKVRILAPFPDLEDRK
ncbi:MAG TPA: hypothetical protein VIJ14_09370 [Rhabdochlamydiaceae bacterium]